MMKTFEDKIAIVTGGSDGIGLATATLLAAKGAQVIICSRSVEKLERAKKQIIGNSKVVKSVELDLANLPDFKQLIIDTNNKYGRLDILVNNAAVTRHSMIADMSFENWKKNFSVTTDATFVGTKQAMDIMIKQGSGVIINVSSSCGSKAAQGVSGYSAAKAAMTHFSNCAAMECAAYGVRINTVIPGSIATTSNLAAAGGDQNVINKLNDAIPMKRSGTAEEVAAAICFLASDEASFITGVALPVDGGKLAELYVPALLK